MKKIIAFLTMIVIGLTTLAAQKTEPLQPVEYVDVERYLGRWFQIAFFPTRFQRADCGAVVTADYGIDERGRITVENNCWEDLGMSNSLSSITGTAAVIDDSNARLKVRFFWWLPFRANYWIITLDEDDYQYAVVSEPGRNYLWILARENRMDKELFSGLLTDLKNRGFDLEQLAITAPVD